MKRPWRRTVRNVLGLLLFVGASRSFATTYYVSPSGNDSAGGTSVGAAWKTIAKVNSISFAAGDTILFQGGAVFSGSLSFNSSDAGTDANRITLGSYGTGRATINSGNGRGIHLQNTAGFVIGNLVIKGNGIGANASNGIEVSNSSGTRTGIRIQNCEIYDYGSNAGGTTLGNGYGVFFWTSGTAAITKIEVFDTVIHHCENIGFFTWAATRYKISNVTVRGCVFRDNPGRSGLSNHSGSGMLLGSTDTALVEYCSAYNNGTLNTAGAGPVGIWTYDSKNVTIQFCESYANKTTSGADGGGFDLDGGVTDSVIQYCYSHDNHGAGYLLACYSGANPLANNVIRYNISENDGRRGSYGAITLWGAGVDDKVENAFIYGNTIYCGTETAILSGTPSAIYFLSNYLSGIKIWNNIFITKGGTNYLVNSAAALSISNAQLQGNNYWAMGSFRLKWGGTTYFDLNSWMVAASTQERLGSMPVGKTADPLLIAPGAGGTIGNLLVLVDQLKAYRLRPSSPMIRAGLDLQSQFGTNPGGRDFFGVELPHGIPLDIGANEYAAPVLVAAVSHRNHGAAGAKSIPLAFAVPPEVPFAGSANVECRAGADLSIVATFDRAIVSAKVAIAEGAGTLAASPVLSGNEVFLTLISAANAQTLRIEMSDILAEAGAFLEKAVVLVPLRRGDVNGDGAVTTSDVNLVRLAASKSAVTADNFRNDLNCDGVVTVADVNLTRSMVAP